jgi:hypothetical protein
LTCPYPAVRPPSHPGLDRDPTPLSAVPAYLLPGTRRIHAMLVCSSPTAYLTPPTCESQLSPFSKPDPRKRPRLASSNPQPWLVLPEHPLSIAELWLMVISAFLPSFRVCSPKPLAVVLLQCIWCSNRNPFPTFADYMRRCISTQVQQRMGSP